VATQRMTPTSSESGMIPEYVVELQPNRLREGRQGPRRHGATIGDPADGATGVADAVARPGPVLIQPKGFEIARHAFGDKIREMV
jgi:hypothetical protein